MGWKKRTYNGSTFWVFDQYADPETFHIWEHKDRVFIRCPDPTKQFVDERRSFVGRFLPFGDVCLYNPRKQKHYEHALYDDAKTALGFVDTFRPEQVVAVGFCQGATITAHLKLRTPGMHAILQHPSLSTASLIERHGKRLARFALPSLPVLKQGTDEENGLDLMAKFAKCDPSAGTIVIVETDTDTFNPPQTRALLLQAAFRTCDAHLLARKRRAGTEGHHDLSLHDPTIWAEIRRLLV